MGDVTQGRAGASLGRAISTLAPLRGGVIQEWCINAYEAFRCGLNVAAQ